MPRIIKPLTNSQVNAIRKPGWHAVGGAAGLYLQLRNTSARSWILRVTVDGKRYVIGLGPLSLVSLAEAREEAYRRLKLIRQGRIDEGLESRSRSSSSLTFSECADQLIKSKLSEWKNPKSEKQWRSTLIKYAYPVVGQMKIENVTTKEIMSILEPHWLEKTDTMTKLRGRLQKVLDWATTNGYRQGLNPATWEGNLEHLLPAPSRITKGKHHKSLPYSRVQWAYEVIKNSKGVGSRCLELIILTAVRSSEARQARWNEINLEDKVWRIPAERMKMGRDFEIPLTPQMIDLLDELPRSSSTDLVFFGKNNKQLSDMTVLQVLRRNQIPCVVHGFRSTFSTWVAEQTDYPRDVRELSLAHKIGSNVELAYMRGDLMNKRRILMEEWNRYVRGKTNS